MNQKTTNNLCHDFQADLAALYQGIIYLQQELQNLTPEQITVLKLMGEKIDATLVRWPQVKELLSADNQ